MRAHFFCIFGISISTAAISIRPISLRPNRDAPHLVRRVDVGLGLEQRFGQSKIARSGGAGKLFRHLS